MRGIRTISIDLDDTLWPIAPVIARAEKRMRAWLAKHYPRVTEMFTPEAMMELRREVVVEYADQIHDLTFLRRTVLGRVSRAAGYGTEMVDDAFAIFNEERNIVDVFPDVRPGLARLRSSFTLIALTNGNADLAKIGLRDLFDEVISAAKTGAAKPARKIFDEAVRAGGADHTETLHVGDHPEHDVHGARQAGLRAVWVNRDGHDWPENLPEPDGIIEDFAALADLLEAAAR
ncbi:MAG: HAD-IA family hydrolase [Woeseiaceae bacterium]|nr:HAD-IA family hydrolase [Woeseiaceae bacterium]